MTLLTEILVEAIVYRRGLLHSRTTLKTFRVNVRLFLVWLRNTHGVVTADRLTSEHLLGYQRALGGLTNRRGLPYAAGTLNNRIIAVRTFLDYLHMKQLTGRPLKPYLKPVRQPKLLPTSVLTHREVRKLLRRIDTTTAVGIMHRVVLEVLYSTGIRVGELIGVTVDDLDLDEALVKVRGKGGKERMVPIGRTAKRWLESYLRAVRPFLPGHDRHREVFLNRLGKPLGDKSVRAIASKYALEANLEQTVTPHTFRRSCTTELIRGNANLYHVKELLGHESLATLKPYTKLTITDLKKTHAKCHPRERDPDSR